MPYMIQKDGEQFCVYKQGEDGKAMGESLGCHDAEADAKKQLAALYANVPDATEQEQKRSLLERLRHWLGLDAVPMTIAAPVRAIAYQQIYEQVYAGLQAALGEDSYARLVDVYDDLGQTYAIVSANGKLYRTSVAIDGSSVVLGMMQEVEAQFAPVRTGRVAITRDGQGGTRWFAIAGSSVLNRDGEIDSKALFDSFVTHAEKTGEYPELRFFHTPSLRMGVADYVARDGNVYIASGVLDADNVLAAAFEQALADGRGSWGCSIGFLADDYEMHEVVPDVRVPVYRRGVNREISILPEDMAASWYTTVLEVTRMESKVKEALGVLFGDPAKAEAFIATVDETNTDIAERGLVTRAAPATAAPETAAGDSAETAAATAEEPTDAPAPDEKPNLLATMQATLDSMAAMMTALAGRLTAVEGLATQTEAVTQSAKDTAQRLATVETVVGQWQQERTADMPKKTGTTATYRPSVANAAGAPSIVSAAEVAQATLAKLREG
jgi:hypothetical protein